MGNVLDYIEWRGDLTMDQSPFNEVDNLILSQVAYVDFDGIVPTCTVGPGIRIQDAAVLYFNRLDEKELNAKITIIRMSIEMLKKIAGCPRYANLQLSHYVNRIDYEAQKQFSAIHVIIDEDTDFVAYRGTDDTIVGWKENFNMCFMTPIPAQLEAVEYLEQTTLGNQKRLIVGGHSKGGNLAVYAAVNAAPEIKKRILAIYNNDGPGFDRVIIETAAYQEMLGRIRTIVPESSIVGMLLEHEEEFVVVKCTQKMMLQHYTWNWEVMGNHFVLVDQLSEKSRRLDVSVKNTFNRMDTVQREQFVDALFYAFDATNIKSLNELTQISLRKVTEMLRAINNMSQEGKDILVGTLKTVIKERNRIYRSTHQKGELVLHRKGEKGGQSWL